jgi:hypothetical protein
VGGDRGDGALGELILKVERLVAWALDLVGPQDRAALDVGELGGDADAIAPAAHAPRQHIANGQLLPHRLHVHRALAVARRRGPGDHHQVRERRECGDDVFHHAVPEVLLRLSRPEFTKGQDGDRWP